MKQYIVLNCGYGNGPYLRATEIALAVTKQIPGEWGIVVPHVYGDRQHRILQEEFGVQRSLILDEQFGSITKKVFFDGTSYAQFLQHWLDHADDISQEARHYLQITYGNDIAMEISRAPLLTLGIDHAYFNSFSRTSDILTASVGNDAIAISDTLLQQAVNKMKELEDAFRAYFISVPGTFAPKDGDIPIPPTAIEKPWTETIERGVYVTTSGIPNTESLTQITEALQMPVYTNNAAKIPGALELPPSALASEHIVAHIARAGWGAIWSSILTETPLITLPYSSTDDPEIYFNNGRIAELGIGAVWNGQSVKLVESMKSDVCAYKSALLEQFDGKKGAEIAAEKIATLEV